MQLTRPAVPVATVATVVAMAVAVVTAFPEMRFHIERPTAAAVVLTARGLAEVFAAYAASQRFARTASGRYFGIAVALGVMAVADLGFMIARATVAPDGEAAAVLPYHLVGAALLAAAALAPRQALVRRPRPIAVLTSVAAISGVLLLVGALGVIPSLATQLTIDAPDVTLLRLATCALFALAALALALNHDARTEPPTKWLALAACLASVAQLERFVEAQSVLTTLTWMHVYLIAFMVALLVGSLTEGRDHQRRLAELAVADERRRVGRDLHDGLAQEVAFIASQTKHLAVQSGDQRLDEIAVAAERALDDSRAVVGALSALVRHAAERLDRAPGAGVRPTLGAQGPVGARA